MQSMKLKMLQNEIDCRFKEHGFACVQKQHELKMKIYALSTHSIVIQRKKFILFFLTNFGILVKTNQYKFLTLAKLRYM